MEILLDENQKQILSLLTLFVQEFFQIIKAHHFDVLILGSDQSREAEFRLEINSMTTSNADYALLANKENNYFLYPFRQLRFLCYY
jgi:hypothetical protein